MPTFEYTPLDETTSQIRVVRVLPAEEPSEPPNLELSLLSLQDKNHVAYFPVSYTWNTPIYGLPAEWNDPAKTSTISLNNYTFEVRTNLYSFLLHIRELKKSDEPLWIDAICINQKDIAERNSQVQLMASVYGHGSCTIVWLGPEAQHSTMALEKMWEIEQASDLRHDNDLTLYSATADRDAVVAAIESEIGTDRQVWVSICRFFDRTWWRRAWILQEVILSTKSVVILCGASSIAFSTAMSTFGLINELYEMDVEVTPAMRKVLGYTEEWLSHIQIIRSLWEGKLRRVSNQNLLDVLAHVREQYATDPRDMIYAGLGLAPEGSMVIPDYNATTKTVYTHFARTYIEKHKSLSILGDCTSLGEGLVSWTPNWDEFYLGQRLPRKDRYPGRDQAIYNTSKNTELVAKFSHDSTLLNLMGFRVDVLLEVGDEATSQRKIKIVNMMRRLQDPRSFFEQEKKQLSQAKENWDDLIEQYGHCVQAVEASGSSSDAMERFLSFWKNFPRHSNNSQSHNHLRYLHSEHDIATAFNCTLQADIKIGVKRLPRSPSGTTHWEQVVARQSGVVVPKGPNVTDPQIQWDKIDPYILPSIAWERRFFVSETGYIGLARGAQEGDVICVFLGSEVPFIVRPGKNGHFLLVSEAYVHGLMDGEALEQHEEGKLQLEEITLK